MTARQALVLAGGGLAGIAWETGILRGIADESPAAARRLLDSDVLLGTSAGSAVGGQIGSGRPLDELFDRQIAGSSAELDPRVDIDTITELFLAALRDPPASDTPEGRLRRRMQQIGSVALTTETVSEAVRREVIAQRLPSHEWPDRVLRIAAIDIATGELVVFDRDSGVGLVDAVAASCAVPGAWPPVTIAGRRYMDGGVGSTVNMRAVDDCDVAVVLVPSGADTPSPFGAGPAAEINEYSELHGAARPVLTVFADDESLAAFGKNPLDPRCRPASAAAGREQGRREAARVEAFLNR